MTNALAKALRDVALGQLKTAQAKLDQEHPRIKAVAANLTTSVKFYRIGEEGVRDFTLHASLMNGGKDISHVTLNHTDHGASYQLCKPDSLNEDPAIKNQEWIVIEFVWSKSEVRCEGFKDFLETFRGILEPF